MEISTIKSARKKIIFILILSILCIILISFLPWISVSENDRLEENLHFNYEMMKRSNNEQINNLAYNLREINILYWTIIVISIISFLLIIFYLLLKSSLLIQIMIVTSGCIILVISFLIIYFQIVFSRLINDIENISASMLYPNFAFAYIQFIISIILLIFTATYAIVLLKDSIKQYKKMPKQKKKKIDEKKITTSFVKEEINTKISENIPDKSISDTNWEIKRAEIDKLLSKKPPSKDKPTFEGNIQKIGFDKKKQTDSSSDKITSGIKEIKHEEYEKEKVEKENIKQPFPPQKPKKEPDETDEIQISQHFEKALSSAIEKKQSKTKRKESKEKNEKTEKPFEPKSMNSQELKPEPIFETEKILLEKNGDKINKIFNVKCPKCSHIFPFGKDDESEKIICPKCGKVGSSDKIF